MKPTISYAQNREDIILASFFNDEESGFYIDVGAHHPVFDSVTKYFYARGWTGINIEPIKKYHSLIEADRPKDINLNMGVSNSKGTLTMREYTSAAGEGMSTFSEEIKTGYDMNQHWATKDFVEFSVPVDTLKSILKNLLKTDQKISFLKVDVEGYEYEVLKGNDWKLYRPKIICIEANHIVKDWRVILEKHGYSEIFDDGLNKYYIDNDNFSDYKYSYAENLLMQFPDIIKWQDYKKVTALNNKSKVLSRDIIELENQLDQALIKLKAPGLRNAIKTLKHELDGYFYRIKKSEQTRIRKYRGSFRNETQKYLYNSELKKRYSGRLVNFLGVIYKIMILLLHKLYGVVKRLKK